MQVGSPDDGTGDDDVQQNRTSKILAGRAGAGFFARPFGFCGDDLVPLT
jgi:hypothetical protein